MAETPEDKARKNIDRQLDACGWRVQDRKEADITAIERFLSIANMVQDLLIANLKRPRVLRQSVLKRAFEGKLVEQDPDDEPASVLLARIRSEREREQATAGSKSKTRKRGAGRTEPSRRKKTRVAKGQLELF